MFIKESHLFCYWQFLFFQQCINWDILYCLVWNFYFIRDKDDFLVSFIFNNLLQFYFSSLYPLPCTFSTSLVYCISLEMSSLGCFDWNHGGLLQNHTATGIMDRKSWQRLLCWTPFRLSPFRPWNSKRGQKHLSTLLHVT